MTVATGEVSRGDAARWRVLVVLALAQFMVVVDGTVVNVALPSIQRSLGFAPADLAWVIDAYAIVFGGCCCSAGGPRTCSGAGMCS